MHRFLRVWSFLVLLPALPASAAPLFEIPGWERQTRLLEDCYRLHRVVGPDTTLWDAWLPFSTLWYDTTQAPTTDTLRSTYRDRLLRRRIDAEGYVSTQQHEGLAHSEGWPFPLWTQAGGVGWHFTLKGVPYDAAFGVRPTESVTNWSLAGVATTRLETDSGWTLRFEDGNATLTSPAFRLDAFVAPFLRLQWSARGLGSSAGFALDWQREGDGEFLPERRWLFSGPAKESVTEDANLPLHRHPQWSGIITRLRWTFRQVQPGAELTLRRVFSAIDSRHNVNNALYLQACDDYVRWTGDLGFLRSNLQRMRLALAWAIREFRIAEKEHVHTTWVGHDGRSGHLVDANGKRVLKPGYGVGNNYWDLLPFGGEDTLASIYYFDVLRRMAALERQVERHPEWDFPRGPLQFEPAELVQLADQMREFGNRRFWNEATGRFHGWRDLDGRAYDYGFTFVNNEAIYFGFASPEHSRSIRDWIDGRRVVAGDTATGPDLYRWRFGPRATTLRNVETYFWGWSDPASVPWGGQVQDGGAVFGFSFHDLMARLEVNGPDDAARRLGEILDWFEEVQKAGGYRAYYAERERGTLQGGGTAGGLGLDHEFFESVLVPQIMLYGFLGFHPRVDGCFIAPRLPASWPSLTVRGVRLHDVVLDITAEPGRLRIAVTGEPVRPLRLFTPGGEDARVDLRGGIIDIARPPK